MKKRGDVCMQERRIVCIEGELKDSEIVIRQGEEIVVGREPRFSNLVFRDMTISRKHCVIELDEQGDYYVTDYSECGVTTGTGHVLEKMVKTKCVVDTVLCIGKAGTKIKLR